MASWKGRISIEGRVARAGDRQRRQAGGGHVLCPEALADDGLLDVSILPAPQEVVGTLRELMNNGWGLDAMFVRAPLPWVEIKVAQGLYINLDGEPLEGDDLRFKALPGPCACTCR
jgi:diacylglycerol kinase family enzyme